jgi:leader peptidase (prepilin peptidase) / N-methyltransferase
VPEQMPLGISLGVTVFASLLVSAWIWWRFARLIDDEAGLRLLRGLGRNDKPSGFVTSVLTSAGAVLAWLAAFVTPALLSRTWADLPVLIAFGLVAGATGWLYWIDTSIHRLPNRIVLPLTGAAVLLFFVAVVIGVFQDSSETDQQWAGGATTAINGLIGGLVLLLVFLALNILGALLARRGMGGGDVKLAVVVGMLPAALSPFGLVVALVVMNLSALAQVLFAVTAQQRGMREAIAYGPHMLIGTWTAVIIGPVFL